MAGAPKLMTINTQLIVRTPPLVQTVLHRPVEVACRIGTWLFRRFPVAENAVFRELEQFVWR
jgi:hypothetical protein